MGTTCVYDATRHSDVLGSRLDDQKVGVQRIWATIRTQLRDLCRSPLSFPSLGSGQSIHLMSAPIGDWCLAETLLVWPG